MNSLSVLLWSFLLLLSSAVAQERKPIGDELYRLIQASGIDSAISEYRKLKETSADKYNFGEEELNRLGYRLLGESKFDQAIAIFRLNVETYPASIKSYDSLADAYLRTGETAKAITAYEQVLVIADCDSGTTQELRETIIANAKGFLAGVRFRDQHQLYLGAYSLGNGQYINIGIYPDSQIIHATFTHNGDVRYLTETSPHIFSYGPTRSKNIPVQGLIKFFAAKDRTVNSLRWESDGKLARTAQRVPYRLEEVSFNNGAKAKLAGSLITPFGKKRYPVAVLIPQSDRYDLWDLAMWLVPQGIAVLVYDQRNSKMGFSIGAPVSGYYSQQQALYAEDAAAAVRFVRSHPRVNPRKVGVIGWSGGAWMGAMVAANHVSDLAFCVDIAANASDWYDQLRHSSLSRLLREGFSDSDIAQANQYFDVYFGVAQGKVDWETYQRARDRVSKEKWFLLLNRVIGINNRSLESAREWADLSMSAAPTREFEKVTCPMLGLFFEFDQSNPPDTPEIFRRALQRAGNQDFTVKIFSSLNHGAWKVSGYGFKPDEIKQRSPEVFSTLILWLKKRIQTRGPTMRSTGPAEAQFL